MTTDQPSEGNGVRKHPYAECERCPLYAKGKFVPTTFADTPLEGTPTNLVFVGEAPGNKERIKGEPFVGPSGQLLHRVLQEYAVARESVTLTNATLCHYPPSMEEMPPEAIDACRPRLLHEIDTALPNGGTIVGMGNTALSAINPTDKRGVMAQRVGPPVPVSPDSPLPQPPHDQSRIVATFHPASVLRNQDQLPFLDADIGKALDTHLPGDLAWREPDIRIMDGRDGAADRQTWWAMLTHLWDSDSHQPLVVDTESGQDKDDADGVTEQSPVLCIGLSTVDVNPDSPIWVVGREICTPEVVETLENFITTQGMVAQNGKHDAEVLQRFFADRIGSTDPIPLSFDTMLGHYSLRETSGIHGLSYMATEYLGTPPYDEAVKRLAKKKKGGGKDFALVPIHILYPYNGWDVGATRLLYHFLRRKLAQEPALDPLNRHLLRASPMLQAVERQGMAFDWEHSRALSAQYAAQLHSDEEIGLNPRSPKQVMDYFRSQGYRASDTQEATITQLSRTYPQDTTLTSILENRKTSKLDGTYVTGVQKHVTSAGRVHASFRMHATTTGRLASRNPNFQNQPGISEIKAQYTVDDRTRDIFIHRDYGQIELRIMAWLAQDEGMRALFNDPDRDVFDDLMSTMWGSAILDSPDYKFYRRLIKTFAYGIAYGREYASIATAFNISPDEAKDQMRRFQAMIPDIMAFQQEVVARIHRGEDLVNPFGRHRRFYLITSANQRNVEKEAMAFLPQSTASDICVMAAYLMHERHRLDIRNLIHDAILAHARRDEADEISRIMGEVMVEAAREVTHGYIDFTTDVTMGSTWGDV